MPSVGFEPTISAGERPLTYALDRAATGIGILKHKEEFATELHQYFITYNYISVTFTVALYMLLVWNVPTSLVGVRCSIKVLHQYRLLCCTEIKPDSKWLSIVFEKNEHMYELEGLYCNYYLTFKWFFKPNTFVQLFTIFTHDKDGSDTISN